MLSASRRPRRSQEDRGRASAAQRPNGERVLSGCRQRTAVYSASHSSLRLTIRVQRGTGFVAAGAAAVLAFIAGPSQVAPAQVTPRGVASPPLASPGLLEAARSVSFRALAARPPGTGTHPAFAHRFLTVPRQPLSRTVSTPAPLSLLTPLGGMASPRSGSALVTTSGPTLLTAFHAESLNSDIAAHGSDQNVAPPDTQLAAGPSDLVSPVNNTLWVWSKTGIA